MRTRKLRTIAPGEILLQEFLKPLGITQYRLARQTGVPNTRIAEIVRGRRAITADTALRLGRFFGNSPRIWLNLQAEHDLRTAEQRLERRLQREVTPLEAAH